MWRKMKGARNEKRNPLLILYSPRFPLSLLHPLSLIPFAAHFTFNFSPSVWAHPVSPSLFSHLAFFFFHLFLSFSFSWSPSPHVYPHIFLCPSTLWFGHLTSDVLYDSWIVSDVLFTAWNNDIFIPVQKAATHEAVSASIIQCIKKNWKIMIENFTMIPTFFFFLQE